MTLYLRGTLNAALDELENVIRAQTELEQTRERALKVDPKQIAMNLSPKDFGGDVNATLGLNYMKGEIEVLRDERDEARKRAVDVRAELATVKQQLSTSEWTIKKLEREITKLEAELAVETDTEED